MKVALKVNLVTAPGMFGLGGAPLNPPFLNQRGAPSSPDIQRTLGARGDSHKAAGDDLSERRPSTSAVGALASARLRLLD